MKSSNCPGHYVPTNLGNQIPKFCQSPESLPSCPGSDSFWDGNFHHCYRWTQVLMEKKPVHLIHHVLTRILAWGFSSSGVERTFARAMQLWQPSSQRTEWMSFSTYVNNTVWGDTPSFWILLEWIVGGSVGEQVRLIMMAQMEWEIQLNSIGKTDE